MRVEFHPAAQAESEDAQAWYEEGSLIAAAGFLRELSDAIRRAANSPDRYPKSTAGTQRVMLDRFPFTVFIGFSQTFSWWLR
jgi:plasmid stabilization system protein ParE